MLSEIHWWWLFIVNRHTPNPEWTYSELINPTLIICSETENPELLFNPELLSEPTQSAGLNSEYVKPATWNRPLETKLLGVTLDSKLSWSRHIDLLVQKMGRNISVVKRCSSFLTPHLSKQVLQTLVLSQLDYCSVVWSGTTKTNLGKLQRVQNRAARLALKCTSRTNVKNMHDRLFWLKVDERLKASLLSFIKKINTLKTPDCLFRQLTLSSNIHTYPTRHATSGNYTIPTIKTQNNVQY